MTGTNEPVAAEWPWGVVMETGKNPAVGQSCWLPGTIATPVKVSDIISNDQQLPGVRQSYTAQ